jgi:hypothetical protein
MRTARALPTALLLLFVCVSNSSGQANDAPNPSGSSFLEPPYLLLLVHQEVQFGKAAARQKLGVAVARICNRMEVPNSWIDLQSLTGPREALFFDPFDSFGQIEQAFTDWNKIYATHPDLARMQEEIDATLKSEDTAIAVRRDDLGYLVDHIDFSTARFMRVVEVRLLPGHEGDFMEASTILSDAYNKIGQDAPWVVYQVQQGMESSVFLTLMPMPALTQNDDELTWEEDLRKAEGEEGSRRLEELARNGYVTTKSNLYAVNPEMSHVPKAVAERDPGFWNPKPIGTGNGSVAKGSAAGSVEKSGNNPPSSQIKPK